MLKALKYKQVEEQEDYDGPHDSFSLFTLCENNLPRKECIPFRILPNFC
jgi:hypothetical protein